MKERIKKPYRFVYGKKLIIKNKLNGYMGRRIDVGDKVSFYICTLMGKAWPSLHRETIASEQKVGTVIQVTREGVAVEFRYSYSRTKGIAFFTKKDLFIEEEAGRNVIERRA